MKTHTTKIKIIAVGPIQISATTKATTRKVVLQVAEVPENPFGHTLEPSAPFDVDVYNHNIENFNINTSLIGEIADCELLIKFYKRDSNPAQPRIIVNDLNFRI